MIEFNLQAVITAETVFAEEEIMSSCYQRASI